MTDRYENLRGVARNEAKSLGRPVATRGRRFTIGHAMLVAGSIAAGGVGFAWVAWGPDLIRERVATTFETRTGRTLAIDGPVSLALWPPGFTLERVSIRAPEPSPGPLLTADRVRVAVPLHRLLAGTARPERITLERPKLLLHVAADGRKSWDRADHVVPGRVQVAEAPQTGRIDTGQAVPWQEKEKVRGPLGHIEVVDGEIELSDERLAHKVNLTAVQGSLAQPEAGSAITINSQFVWNHDVLQLKGSAERLARSPSDAIPVDVAIAGRGGRAHYRGTVAGHDGLALDGRLTVHTDRLADALEWLTGERPVADNRPLEAVAKIASTRGRIALTELAIRSPAIAGAGRLTIERRATRPELRGALRLALLDLDALLDTSLQKAGGTATQAPVPKPVQPNQPGPPAPILESENDPATAPAEGGVESGEAADDRSRRRGRSRSVRPWRETPLPFASLERFQVDTELSVGRLLWRGGEVGALSAQMTVTAGTLRLDVESAALFGGQARGIITADTSGRITVEANLNNAAALELLRSTARFEVLEGPATVRVAVSGRGQTEKDIVSTLTGTAGIEIIKGALRGWSVSDALEEARRLQIPDLRRNPIATTPFERLEATVALKDGIATLQDARISASPISLESSGTINLPEQTLALTLTPRVGDGGRFAGLAVPLKLAGAWSDPRLSADVQRMLRAPGKALEAARAAAKEAARGVKEEDIDKAARRLLGEGEAARKGAERAKQLLRRFLKE